MASKALAAADDNLQDGTLLANVSDALDALNAEARRLRPAVALALADVQGRMAVL